MSEYIYATDDRDGHWLTGEEIVRCRDCKWYEPRVGAGEPHCVFNKADYAAPNGFCNWGRRRDMSKQKAKGTAFETETVEYINNELTSKEQRLIREPLHGSGDVGDIHGASLFGYPVVIECKNHKRMELAEWLDETEREADLADTPYGFLVHKRRGCGKANFGNTYVTCTLDTFIRLLQDYATFSKSAKPAPPGET